MSLDKIRPASPSSRIPIAKPASVVPRIEGQTEPEAADLVEDLLSPTSIRGFAWSIGGHAIFLLILAFWYFSPPLSPAVIFDTRLAGSEFGDPSSDQLTGALGMDTPLALPEVANGETLSETNLVTITSVPASELKPELSTSPKSKAPGAANGGGVNLANPGFGGNGDGFGVAKFGNGGETINGVQVKVGDPQFTLIWDTLADIDLHVIEPGGDHIDFTHKIGEGGGELDVDDTNGFGPENINYGESRGATGTYRWYVHYYAGVRGQVPKTRWKVRIKNGGQITQKEGVLSRVDQTSETLTLKYASGKPSEVASVATAPPDRASVGSTAVPTDPASDPARFAPPKSGISVLFGDPPRASRIDLATPLGTFVADHFAVEKSEGAWELTLAEIPSASLAKIEPSTLLTKMVDQVVADHKGVASRNVQVSLQGESGREVEFSVPEPLVAGGGMGRARVFLTGGKLVIVTTLGTKKFTASTASDLYLRSLEIAKPK